MPNKSELTKQALFSSLMKKAQRDNLFLDISDIFLYYINMLKLKENYRYSYSDYLSWSDEERWEIFEGDPYMMSPAPNPYHQEIIGEIHRVIANHFKDNNSKCKVYLSPIDVILSDKDSQNDDEIFTVVQPDIIITCDIKKIDNKGHRGAPDFIIEVVSPFNASNDYITKLALYQKYGVKEYWIVDPQNSIVEVYILNENGEYSKPQHYSRENKVALSIIDELEIDFSTVFKEIK